MGTYNTSYGERVSQSQIDSNIRKAKLEFTQNVEPYCHGCGRTGERLSVSHTLSVDKCKKSGRSELAWDINNFELECTDCHLTWEGGTKEEKKKLLNYENKVSYLESININIE